MKFKSYLNESQQYEHSERSKAITENEAVDLIKKHCKKSWKAYADRKTYIYRGIRSVGGPYLYTDPTKGPPRVSANTLNFYTLWIDNDPTWKDFPKRSRSLICSNDFQGASGYGRVFLVFPYDNAKIGVCPSHDMWWSFMKSEVEDLDDFNSAIAWIIERLGLATYHEMKSLSFTYKAFLDLIKQVGKRYMDAYADVGIQKRRWLYSARTFEENIRRVLDPKANKFKVVNPGVKLPDQREVWVGNAPSILIDFDVIGGFELAVK